MLAFAAVAEQPQIAAGVVLVSAPVKRLGGEAMVVADRGDDMLLHSSLSVVLVVAEQVALLTVSFAAVVEAVAGKAFTVEVDGCQAGPLPIVVGQPVAVR